MYAHKFERWVIGPTIGDENVRFLQPIFAHHFLSVWWQGLSGGPFTNFAIDFFFFFLRQSASWNFV